LFLAQKVMVGFCSRHQNCSPIPAIPPWVVRWKAAPPCASIFSALASVTANPLTKNSCPWPSERAFALNPALIGSVFARTWAKTHRAFSWVLLAQHSKPESPKLLAHSQQIGSTKTAVHSLPNTHLPSILHSEGPFLPGPQQNHTACFFGCSSRNNQNRSLPSYSLNHSDPAWQKQPSIASPTHAGPQSCTVSRGLSSKHSPPEKVFLANKWKDEEHSLWHISHSEGVSWLRRHRGRTNQMLQATQLYRTSSLWWSFQMLSGQLLHIYSRQDRESCLVQWAYLLGVSEEVKVMQDLHEFIIVRHSKAWVDHH